jgi:hypothetical protein
MVLSRPLVLLVPAETPDIHAALTEPMAGPARGQQGA